MINISEARRDPERFRAALARRGAAEAFDELMTADARWRELVPQVDELRGTQKLKFNYKDAVDEDSHREPLQLQPGDTVIVK